MTAASCMPPSQSGLVAQLGFDKPGPSRGGTSTLGPPIRQISPEILGAPSSAATSSSAAAILPGTNLGTTDSRRGLQTRT